MWLARAGGKEVSPPLTEPHIEQQKEKKDMTQFQKMSVLFYVFLSLRYSIVRFLPRSAFLFHKITALATIWLGWRWTPCTRFKWSDKSGAMA